jgi:hypothetical protein
MVNNRNRRAPAIEINIEDFQTQATECPEALEENEHVCSQIKKRKTRGAFGDNSQRQEAKRLDGIPPPATIT